MGINTGREPNDETRESATDAAKAVESGRNRWVGDYTGDGGYTMNVATGAAKGTYAFSIKDAAGNIKLQSTARNFTDMGMVIEVWKMARAVAAKDSQAVAGAARKAA